MIAVSKFGPVVWLGPQRFRPRVAESLEQLGVDGRVAVITAGWEEREQEIEDLDRHLGGRSIPLGINVHWERMLAADEDLRLELNELRTRLRNLQELYQYRLGFAIEPAREMLSRKGSGEALLAARRSAIRALRTLDAGHLRSVDRVLRSFEERLEPLHRPAVRLEREAIAESLSQCAAVAIAGGHVGILLHRLRLLGLNELWGELPIVAWGAGAMVLAPRIVLFHDRPPQGAGNAELLGHGLARVQGAIALPDPRQRLILDNRVRVSLLARRFSPDRCVGLDEGGAVFFDSSGMKPDAGALTLMPRGSVRAGIEA